MTVESPGPRSLRSISAMHSARSISKRSGRVNSCVLSKHRWSVSPGYLRSNWTVARAKKARRKCRYVDSRPQGHNSGCRLAGRSVVLLLHATTGTATSNATTAARSMHPPINHARHCRTPIGPGKSREASTLRRSASVSLSGLRSDGPQFRGGPYLPNDPAFPGRRLRSGSGSRSARVHGSALKQHRRAPAMLRTMGRLAIGAAALSWCQSLGAD